MAVPIRRIHEPGTYFVTSRTWQSRRLFMHRESCRWFVECLARYRDEGHYALHGFVLMPEHLHVLITPAGRVALERVVQLIKGGSAHRIGENRRMGFPVWQRGFSDHRIRNCEDFEAHVLYIKRNPVKRGLVESAEKYEWSSASGNVRMDDVPQRLKPLAFAATNRHG